MEKIGIIGITSEGASLCYKTIIAESTKTLGEFKNVEVVLVQPNFNNILEAQKKKDWNKVATIIIDSGKQLEKLGVTKIVIPANSIHFAIKKIQEGLDIPVINILDVVKNVCIKENYKKALILGVGITMSDNLYKAVLENNNVTYTIPNEDDCNALDRIIYEELVKGIVNPESTREVLNIIQKGRDNLCDVAILACTELPMAIKNTNSPVPTIDTNRELALASLLN
ncbi:amino acid racemase [bacterium]|nr:amino acid racemase [bacterium]